MAAYSHHHMDNDCFHKGSAWLVSNLGVVFLGYLDALDTVTSYVVIAMKQIIVSFNTFRTVLGEEMLDNDNDDDDETI